MGRRAFGSVRRLPSGRYQARYIGPDGGRRTSPDTFPIKGDATRWLARIETELSRGQWTDPGQASVTLAKYAEAWLSQRTVKGKPLAPRTLDTYRHSLDAWILPRLGQLRLAAVTPAVVRTWHSDTLAQTGPTATRQSYALLRAIFNTAVQDEAVHRNPCRIPGAGQATSPERPLLDLSAVEAIIQEMPPHLQVLTVVAFWGHLRRGEVLALRREDVDLAAGTLFVRRQIVETDNGPLETAPKAASIRTVHLPAQALGPLAAWMAGRPGLPNAPLFTRQDGSQLRAGHLEWAWRSARARAGYPNAHLHDLRHAGLTLTAQLGATIAELQRRGGHSSTRAALIYQHAAAQRDERLAKLMSELPPSARALSVPKVRARTGENRSPAVSHGKDA